MIRRWKKVVCAEELPDCEGCDDKWCAKHRRHYADCPCIGPTQEGIMYKTVKGVLMGRPMTRHERKKHQIA